MDEKLVQLRYMVVTALFVNYKLNEDPIIRSTFDELLKPLVIKEVKGFMLLLTKTPRKFRSVLELVSDVVDEIIKNRFDNSTTNTVVQNLQNKFDALTSFASKELSKSSFSDEIAFLASLDVSKLKEKDKLLFDNTELFIINHLGFKTLLNLHSDDPFLFDKRVIDALNLYEAENFRQQHQIEASHKKKTLEDVNRPQMIESLADDKRF